MTKLNKKLNIFKGYSFIEGVIATFVVTVGMLAVLQLVTSSLAVIMNSREQASAVFLAQEGVEIVRNIRDNNWATPSPHLSTFDNTNFPGNSVTNCAVDYVSTAITSCNNNSKTLQRDSATGALRYIANGTNTQFKRKIMITYYDENGNSSNRVNASSATVISVVTWGNKDFPNTIDTTHCNGRTDNKCAFVSVTLNKWGGFD